MGARRVSETDGVVTRPFYTTEEKSVPWFYLWISHWKKPCEKTSWLGRSCFWCGDDAHGASCKSKNNRLRWKVVKLVQPENYNKFLGELRNVSGLPLSLGPRCCDRLSCWLESEPNENLSARLQTYLGCECNGAANEYKTGTRVWPGSSPVCCP